MKGQYHVRGAGGSKMLTFEGELHVQSYWPSGFWVTIEGSHIERQDMYIQEVDAGLFAGSWRNRAGPGKWQAPPHSLGAVPPRRASR